jgi:hypothetical protein
MKKRELNSKFEADFAAFLKDHGYPENSIYYEPAIRATESRFYDPDFLIVDPNNGERLAIIEVKSRITGSFHELKNQIDGYKKSLGDIGLPAFVVAPSDTPIAGQPFDLFVFDKSGELEKVDFRLFPNFYALSTNKTAEKKKEIKAEKDAVAGSFEKLSWCLAAILVVIIVADFICSQYDMTLVTTERLTLLGGAFALLIIPFAQKFKGLGIEWERATSKKDKSD